MGNFDSPSEGQSDIFGADSRVACEACGVLHEEGTALLHELQDTIHVLQGELTKKLKRIKYLEREGDRKLQNSPHYGDALQVLEYWREKCHPEAKQLGGERLKNVIERLKPDSVTGQAYTVEELKLCVDGYARFPYIVNDGRAVKRSARGTPAQRRIDAELVFRDPQHVSQGLALVAEAEDQSQRATVLMDQKRQPNPGLSDLGAAAQRYAGRGWLVFPCKEGGKHPRVREGLLTARADPEAVVRYWSKVPNANVGVRTGRETGIVVMDVDSHHDGFETLRKLEKKHGKLPVTASVKTPRGGTHFYFIHPNVEILNTQGIPGPGIDIRGDGGYVLAVPSRVGGRSYEVDESAKITEMPKWLVKDLLDAQRKGISSIHGDKIDEFIARGVKEGARDASLTRLAGWQISIMKPGDEGRMLSLLKAVNSERCIPPLPDKDVEKCFHSILRKENRKAQRQIEEGNA